MIESRIHLWSSQIPEGSEYSRVFRKTPKISGSPIVPFEIVTASSMAGVHEMFDEILLGGRKKGSAKESIF